jgi:xylan 1,4-beta-xylosidase
VKVDCGKSAGVIRAINGGNCGPIQNGGMIDLSDGYRELGFQSLRLHDCHWPNADVVDVHVVFPNFAADPALPESYNFSRTDDYVRATLATGAKVIYRLGESIEHSAKKYHVHPPTDPEKWAAVCVGIIRHYNEGWAGGFHLGIEHWEIWNEPENRPQMWTGSDEQYFQLYETAAKAIKAKFPKLKVGGPALGYTGALRDGKFEPSAFMLAFLERCRSRSIPLDFFSWHLYTDDPAECLVRSRAIRDVLNRHGFDKAELHFNEWNYLPDNKWDAMLPSAQGAARETFFERVGSARGAAFSASVLCNLQDSPVDVANYFMSDNQPFGLFTAHGVPRKTFYAFKAFKMLLDTPGRLEARGGEPSRMTLCAGVDEKKSKVQLLLSNYKSPESEVRITITHLPWNTPTGVEVFILDDARDLTKVSESQTTRGEVSLLENLPAPSVCLIRLSPKGRPESH